MNFELFTDFGRGYRPTSSIRTNGQLGFNRGSIHRFGLSDGYAQLFYDREAKIIGVKPVSDDSLPGATRFVVKSNNAFISARSLLEYYGIVYREKTRAYEASWDECEKMILVDLNKPIRKEE